MITCAVTCNNHALSHSSPLVGCLICLGYLPGTGDRAVGLWSMWGLCWWWLCSWLWLLHLGSWCWWCSQWGWRNISGKHWDIRHHVLSYHTRISEMQLIQVLSPDPPWTVHFHNVSTKNFNWTTATSTLCKNSGQELDKNPQTSVAYSLNSQNPPHHCAYTYILFKCWYWHKCQMHCVTMHDCCMWLCRWSCLHGLICVCMVLVVTCTNWFKLLVKMLVTIVKCVCACNEFACILCRGVE